MFMLKHVVESEPTRRVFHVYLVLLAAFHAFSVHAKTNKQINKQANKTKQTKNAGMHKSTLASSNARVSDYRLKLMSLVRSHQ